MTALATTKALPSMSAQAIGKVARLEFARKSAPQVAIETTHHLHAGLYARTIHIPAGVLITGALIKIPTLLIISGHVTAFVGETTMEVAGYQVLQGEALRKQAFIAHQDTCMTMLFATQAQTVEQAESEFTDETDLLLSRGEG